jgi:hypothetical protein
VNPLTHLELLRKYKVKIKQPSYIYRLVIFIGKRGLYMTPTVQKEEMFALCNI